LRDKPLNMYFKAIDAVDRKLWSEEDRSYMDLQTIVNANGISDRDGEIYRLLTQDVSYYLIAITANTVNDSFIDVIHHHKKNEEQQLDTYRPKKISDSLQERAISTLDVIKKSLER